MSQDDFRFVIRSGAFRVKKIKTIALYLPQFHRLPENDCWWGDGFTDWTAVKAAKPLFAEHQQPKEPLTDNYYNLLDKRTMQWQSKLAKNYRVDGFCFYHYWFKDGRKILEKPAENLLRWSDVDMPFCFCWANESWARSWGAVTNANPWADKFEPQGDETKSAVLLEQEYGNEADWEAHFQYLLSFFKDCRYIRVEGKPVFVIYRPELMLCLERMLACWRNLALLAGLPGIYIVGMNVHSNIAVFDAVISIMPKANSVYVKKMGPGQINGMDYGACWEDYLMSAPVAGTKTLWCGIVDYDDTPRRGAKGYVYLGATPELFGKYYSQLVQKSIQMHNPLLFINAWNEWGEGMYLEPDKVSGLAYLEAVKAAMENTEKNSFRETVPTDIEAASRRMSVRIMDLEKRVEKFKQYYDLMHQWMLRKEQGKSLVSYFLAQDYRRVAIYGYGNNGRHLEAELRNSPIHIVYAIDRDRSILAADFPVYALTDTLPACDVVIVTIPYVYGKILSDLDVKVNCPIRSLAEVVLEAD